MPASSHLIAQFHYALALQENITRLANYRRISLQESVSAVDESIPSFLSLVREETGLRVCDLHCICGVLCVSVVGWAAFCHCS